MDVQTIAALQKLHERIGKGLEFLQDAGVSVDLLTQLSVQLDLTVNHAFPDDGLDHEKAKAEINSAATEIAMDIEVAQAMRSLNSCKPFMHVLMDVFKDLTGSPTQGVSQTASLRTTDDWAKNTTVAEWTRLAGKMTSRSGLVLVDAYQRSGADALTLNALGKAVVFEKAMAEGPFQTFSDPSVNDFTIKPIDAERRVWMTRHMRLATKVAEYNDGYLGFGTAFETAESSDSFALRSGYGIPMEEIIRVARENKFVVVYDVELVRTLLMAASSLRDDAEWYHYLVDDGLCVFILDVDANGLLASKMQNSNSYLPIAAVFPRIAAIVHSNEARAQVLLDTSGFALYPQQDEIDLRVEVLRVDFYLPQPHSNALIVWQRFEYLDLSLQDEGKDGSASGNAPLAKFRHPTTIADCIFGVYHHFVPYADDNALCAPARVYRKLISFHRPPSRGTRHVLPRFKDAVLAGSIACELRVEGLIDHETGLQHEMCCSVRWLDTPPTLSGKEYLVDHPPWGKGVTGDELCGATIGTGKLVRTVTWVPGHNLIYAVNPDLDQDDREHFFEDVDYPRNTRAHFLHMEKFVPGKQPVDKSKCDPRVNVAMAKWDKAHEKRVGLEWWRHMERERLRNNCQRSAWLKAWGQFVKQEEAVRANRARKERERNERERKDAERKREEESARQRLREQQGEREAREAREALDAARAQEREDLEGRERAQNSGDLAVERMLEREGAQGQLLWKQAALKYIAEMNKTFDKIVQDQVRNARNQAAQDRKNERIKAAQEAMQSRQIKKQQEKELQAQAQERKAQEKAESRAAFQAERRARAADKAEQAAQNAYQPQANRGKGKR